MTDFETRYILMTTEQVPAKQMAEWLRDDAFADFVNQRYAEGRPAAAKPAEISASRSIAAQPRRALPLGTLSHKRHVRIGISVAVAAGLLVVVAAVDVMLSSTSIGGALINDAGAAIRNAGAIVNQSLPHWHSP
jgi:hypothetical protein